MVIGVKYKNKEGLAIAWTEFSAIVMFGEMVCAVPIAEVIVTHLPKLPELYSTKEM